MRNVLIQISLAIMLIAGAVACNKQPDSAPAAAENIKKPAPALPSMAAAKPKSPKFGISTPNASTHSYRLAPGKPLELKGWYVADEQLSVTYEFNNEKGEARFETRNDVKQNFTDYKTVQGWNFVIPTAKLKPENKLVIHYGDKTWPMTVTVK